MGTEFNELNGEISPDGRWFAYQSDSSGQMEVYVRTFPDDAGGQTLVSTAGGTTPLWGLDSRELFYRSGSQLMAVPIQMEPTFTAATPQPLFDWSHRFGSPGRGYDISPDGQRFLMIKDASSATEDRAALGINVVLNWRQELLERAPVN